MTLRTLTLLTPLLLAAACAPPSEWGRYPEPGSYDDGGPLYARLDGSTGRLHVVTTQPAHIAVFEIVPGRGVGMVYPLTERDEYYQFAGSGWLPPSHLRGSHWLYDGGLPFYQPYAGPARFYLLVASRLPLYTGRYRHSPMSIRTALGLDYASYNETAILTRLVDHIVPQQPQGDWTTDILAVWPDPSYADLYRNQMVRVVCADGRVNVVPVQLAGFACPDRDPTDAPPLNDSTGTGGAVVERPGGRRPRPGEVTRPVDEEVLLPGAEGRDGGRRVLPADEGTGETGDQPPGRRSRGGSVDAGSNPPTQPDGELPVIRRRPVDPDASGRPGANPGTAEGSASPRRRPDTSERPMREPRLPSSEGAGSASPRTETPRSESPRRESPRSETPRSESPRSEAPRTSAPPPAPAPSYSPPPSMPEPRSVPSAGGRGTAEGTPG